MRFPKILTLTALMAVSSPAFAGAKETAARAQYEEGTTAYNLGRFDEAVEHYEAAYKLVHDPNMLFNIAQGYRQAGKLEQALPVFRSFLREAPADVPNRALAERFVEELKRKIEENQAKASAPAEAKPPTAPVAVPTAEPAPATRPPVALAPPPPPAPDLIEEPSPSLSDAPAEGRPFYKTWWFWTAAGTAVVAGTVTAFLLTRRAPDSCDGLGMKCVGVN